MDLKRSFHWGEHLLKEKFTHFRSYQFWVKIGSQIITFLYRFQPKAVFGNPTRSGMASDNSRMEMISNSLPVPSQTLPAVHVAWFTRRFCGGQFWVICHSHFLPISALSTFG
jgi:hypothetical protein